MALTTKKIGNHWFNVPLTYLLYGPKQKTYSDDEIGQCVKKSPGNILLRWSPINIFSALGLVTGAITSIVGAVKKNNKLTFGGLAILGIEFVLNRFLDRSYYVCDVVPGIRKPPESLLKEISEGDIDEITRAVKSVSRYPKDEISEEIKEKLIEYASSSDNTSLRVVSIDSLGCLLEGGAKADKDVKKAVDAILGNMNTQDQDLLFVCMRALGRIAEPTSIEAVIPHLVSTDDAVHSTAAKSLEDYYAYGDVSKLPRGEKYYDHLFRESNVIFIGGGNITDVVAECCKHYPDDKTVQNRLIEECLDESNNEPVMGPFGPISRYIRARSRLESIYDRTKDDYVVNSLVSISLQKDNSERSRAALETLKRIFDQPFSEEHDSAPALGIEAQLLTIINDSDYQQEVRKAAIQLLRSQAHGKTYLLNLFRESNDQSVRASILDSLKDLYKGDGEVFELVNRTLADESENPNVRKAAIDVLGYAYKYCDDDSALDRLSGIATNESSGENGFSLAQEAAEEIVRTHAYTKDEKLQKAKSTLLDLLFNPNTSASVYEAVAHSIAIYVRVDEFSSIPFFEKAGNRNYDIVSEVINRASPECSIETRQRAYRILSLLTVYGGSLMDDIESNVADIFNSTITSPKENYDLCAIASENFGQLCSGFDRHERLNHINRLFRNGARNNLQSPQRDLVFRAITLTYQYSLESDVVEEYSWLIKDDSIDLSFRQAAVEYLPYLWNSTFRFTGRDSVTQSYIDRLLEELLTIEPLKASAQRAKDRIDNDPKRHWESSRTRASDLDPDTQRFKDKVSEYIRVLGLNPDDNPAWKKIACSAKDKLITLHLIFNDKKHNDESVRTNAHEMLIKVTDAYKWLNKYYKPIVAETKDVEEVIRESNVSQGSNQDEQSSNPFSLGEHREPD